MHFYGRKTYFAYDAFRMVSFSAWKIFRITEQHQQNTKKNSRLIPAQYRVKYRLFDVLFSVFFCFYWFTDCVIYRLDDSKWSTFANCERGFIEMICCILFRFSFRPLKRASMLTRWNSHVMQTCAVRKYVCKKNEQIFHNHHPLSFSPFRYVSFYICDRKSGRRFVAKRLLKKRNKKKRLCTQRVYSYKICVVRRSNVCIIVGIQCLCIANLW